MLLDTNVVIYAAQGKLQEHIFAGIDSIACSVISTIEALGYHKLPVDELLALEKLFDKTIILPINDMVVQQAIKFRQARNMELGDAIIAATALINNLELWTANTDDFKHIDDLRLINPLKLVK